MGDIAADVTLDNNLKCQVCSENRFEERDGFYYCQECGTKQEEIRIVEVDQDEELDPETKIKAKKQKICAAKSEKPELTSWEVYNYILRGFVEELLSYGAKEELKLMTLQVWAAYLRRMEVAFFNRKNADLPKLGIKYLPNDAKIIYNHKRLSRKKRQRNRSEDTSCTSGGDSKSLRSFLKSKHKLDESNYSLTSASGISGMTSSTSANSNKAIKIVFNSKARSYLKRKMPVKHITKHEADSEGVLKCHKQPVAKKIYYANYHFMLLNIKQVYSILAIALNLIGDEIQLSDLVRFIYEGHITTSNVLKYFPENIANNGKQILKKVNFYKCPEKQSYKALREHIGLICKNMQIHKFCQPNMIKLVQRYTRELCLPMDIANYIERIINLLPPQFATRAIGNYPGFEPRAMAYIIFTLKLLFGLDDNKEHSISRAAQKLNSKIDLLNHKNNNKQLQLFVWKEWVEYIEMRKIIVSQFSTSACEQYKQCQSTNQELEQMAEEMRRTEEEDNLYNDTHKNLGNKEKLESFRSLLDNFQKMYELSEKEKQTPHLKIEFKPSLTPTYSYLKQILLFCDRETNSFTPIKIPDFIRIDHSTRDINSFLQVKPLITYFKSHQLKLNVQVLPTTENKRYIGIFRSPSTSRVKYSLYKSNFVDEKEWSKIVMNSVAQSMDDLEFISDMGNFHPKYIKKFQKHQPTCKMYKIGDGNNEKMTQRNLSQNKKRADALKRNGSNVVVQSMHSFELFSENNMDPIPKANFIAEPRRNLENIDLFEGISDEESVLNDDKDIPDQSQDSNEDELLLPSQETSVQSNLEEFIKIEKDCSSNMEEKKDEENKLLEMYISNMDCWMILGYVGSMTQLQNSQLREKFPRSFNWLLETCAQTINIEWTAVFEQLLCIETMFCLNINNLENIKNCVYIDSFNPVKEIYKIVKVYQELW